jgi:hypothetical protein
LGNSTQRIWTNQRSKKKGGIESRREKVGIWDGLNERKLCVLDHKAARKYWHGPSGQIQQQPPKFIIEEEIE